MHISINQYLQRLPPRFQYELLGIQIWLRAPYWPIATRIIGGYELHQQRGLFALLLTMASKLAISDGHTSAAEFEVIDAYLGISHE